jgi:hypothetical protein
LVIEPFLSTENIQVFLTYSAVFEATVLLQVLHVQKNVFYVKAIFLLASPAIIQGKKRPEI